MGWFDDNHYAGEAYDFGMGYMAQGGHGRGSGVPDKRAKSKAKAKKFEQKFYCVCDRGRPFQTKAALEGHCRDSKRPGPHRLDGTAAPVGAAPAAGTPAPVGAAPSRCPRCKSELVLRHGPFGTDFFGCTMYFKTGCKGTAQVPPSAASVAAGAAAAGAYDPASPDAVAAASALVTALRNDARNELKHGGRCTAIVVGPAARCGGSMWAKHGDFGPYFKCSTCQHQAGRNKHVKDVVATLPLHAAAELRELDSLQVRRFLCRGALRKARPLTHSCAYSCAYAPCLHRSPL